MAYFSAGYFHEAIETATVTASLQIEDEKIP
jgi:hypothetical protein